MKFESSLRGGAKAANHCYPTIQRSDYEQGYKLYKSKKLLVRTVTRENKSAIDLVVTMTGKGIYYHA